MPLSIFFFFIKLFSFSRMEARRNVDFLLTPKLENSMEIVYEQTHTNVSYLQLIILY